MGARITRGVSPDDVRTGTAWSHGRRSTRHRLVALAALDRCAQSGTALAGCGLVGAAS